MENNNLFTDIEEVVKEYIELKGIITNKEKRMKMLSEIIKEAMLEVNEEKAIIAGMVVTVKRPVLKKINHGAGIEYIRSCFPELAPALITEKIDEDSLKLVIKKKLINEKLINEVIYTEEFGSARLTVSV